MNDPAAVGIRDRVTGVDNRTQESTERQLAPLACPWRLVVLVESLERGAKGLALDEVHRVIGAAVGVPAQAVHGNDPGVFQAARDLRLEQESRLCGRVLGEARQ